MKSNNTTINCGAAPKTVHWPDGTPFCAADLPQGWTLEIDPSTGEILAPPRDIIGRLKVLAGRGEEPLPANYDHVRGGLTVDLSNHKRKL